MRKTEPFQLCESGERAARQTDAIFDVLLKYLHHDHLDYAVELALAGELKGYGRLS